MVLSSIALLVSISVALSGNVRLQSIAALTYATLIAIPAALMMGVNAAVAPWFCFALVSAFAVLVERVAGAVLCVHALALAVAIPAALL